MKGYYGSFQKLSIHLFEYYFGQGVWVTFIRLLVGPILLSLSLLNIFLELGFSSEIVSILILLYSIYFMIRPYLWILRRLDRFKSEELITSVGDSAIKIEQSGGASVKIIEYQEIKKIRVRNKHITLEHNRKEKTFYPKNLFSDEEIARIKSIVEA